MFVAVHLSTIMLNLYHMFAGNLHNMQVGLHLSNLLICPGLDILMQLNALMLESVDICTKQ